MNTTPEHATHTINLIPGTGVWASEGTKGHFWKTPDNIRLVGSFRHQGRNAPFGVTYSAPAFIYDFRGGPVEVSGKHEAWLSARASVISAYPQESQTRIEVATGDHIILTNEHGVIGEFVIADDRRLDNPRLVLL